MIAEDSSVNGWKVDFKRRPSSRSSEPDAGTSFDAFEEIDPSADSVPDSEPWEPLLRHLVELRNFVRLYVSLRVDQWRAAGRSFVIHAALLAIVSVLAVTTLITAAVLFVNGLATGLGILFGDRIWLGQVILGGGLLVSVGGILAWIGRHLRILEHQRLVSKYEMHLQRQRATAESEVD